MNRSSLRETGGKWDWDQQQSTAEAQKDVCSYCKETFPRKELTLQDPFGSLCSRCSSVLGVQSDEIMIPCTKCNETFSQMAFLYNHMKSVHSDGTDMQIDWDKLFESSNPQDVLSRQSQTNRVLKTFRCDMCDKSYTCNSMLLDHINSKHARRCYQCACGAVFSWRSGLERHKKKCAVITQKDIS